MNRLSALSCIKAISFTLVFIKRILPLNETTLSIEILQLILIKFTNEAIFLPGIIGFYHIATLWTHVINLALAHSHHEAVLGLVEICASADHVTSLRAHIVLASPHHVASLRTGVVHYMNRRFFPYHVALGAYAIETLQIVFFSYHGAAIRLI